MSGDLFGRTNRAFPSRWLQLSAGAGAVELAARAAELGTVLDVTAGTAVLGQGLRNKDVALMRRGGRSIAHAVDDKHASDLIQAELIETLSSLGRETLDFYFLTVDVPLEEVQINGALEALEMARQEGHLRYLGLDVGGIALSALGVWQFHDAFEAVCMRYAEDDQDAYSTLSGLAASRRVGMVLRTDSEVTIPPGAVELRRVSSMADLEALFGAIA